MWSNPASPFVYGFLGDVNLFKGRAHEGQVYLDEACRSDAPEHQAAQNAKAFAYVRPHDLEVERYSPGQTLDAQGRPTRHGGRSSSRAIVVGPIARLELIPSDDTQTADNAVPELLDRSAIPAQQFKEHGLAKRGNAGGHTTPRPSVFLDEAAGI